MRRRIQFHHSSLGSLRGCLVGRNTRGVLASPVPIPDPPKGLEEEFPVGSKGLERHPLFSWGGLAAQSFGCFLVSAAGFRVVFVSLPYYWEEKKRKKEWAPGVGFVIGQSRKEKKRKEKRERLSCCCWWSSSLGLRYRISHFGLHFLRSFFKSYNYKEVEDARAPCLGAGT